MANSIDESTFNQIASKPEAQSKILRLLDKPQNRFLYKPFSSVAPRSQFLGVVLGELQRYIKRNSSVFDYRSDALS